MSTRVKSASGGMSTAWAGAALFKGDNGSVLKPAKALPLVLSSHHRLHHLACLGSISTVKSTRVQINRRHLAWGTTPP